MKPKTNNPKQEDVNILLVGNNPIELSKMLNIIQAIPGHRIMTEIAFDLKSSWSRLMKFHPNFILIDDNIGREELSLAVNTFSNNSKTKGIPITVLKNSNYQETLVTNDVMDYILKQNLTPESLYNGLKNIIKFTQARNYLYQAYRKRKRQLLKLVN